MAAAGWYGTRHRSNEASAPPPKPAGVAAFDGPDAGVAMPEVADTDDLTFRRPSGEAPAITCEEARSIATQVDEELAFDPPRVRSDAFASAVSDWIDPHGFWAASSTAPPFAVIAKNGGALSREILTTRGDCAAAHEVGKSLTKWIGALTERFDARYAHPHPVDFTKAATEPLLDDATTTHAELTTVDMLADRFAVMQSVLGVDAAPIVKAGRERYFPAYGEEGWTRVVLAAAIRAYVPLVDPHSAWAPLDEESSVYEVDLDAHPPTPLWEKVLRTAVGVRIESGALAPLSDGDIVVELDHMVLAGLSLEQVDQLGIVAAEEHGAIEARVLREGETSLRTLSIDAAADPNPAEATDRPDLESHRVAYGDADVGVVAIREVRDDLGDALAHTVHRLRQGDRPLAGLILDLRGNGGGSTEGAASALGMFVPGAQLFPLKRRDGTIETESAPQPPDNEAWTGPLATLVDGSTASAAEMIAGALVAYRRAPTVGRTTYGKGCAQEYEDDDPRTGVLRLTTLLYALPDGTPVQRVGLKPIVRVPFDPLPGEDDTTETEAKLEGAPPTWRGPDMRTQETLLALDRTNAFTWPPPSGAPRPCEDVDVCRALRALAVPIKGPRVAKTGKNKP